MTESDVPVRESEKRFALAVTAAYAVFGIVLSFFHESWRDEADAWLLVSRSTPVEIFHRLAYAGTPTLWYAILFPFAKLGLPYFTIHVVHVAIAAAGAFLLTCYSPFERPLRLLILFSYYLGFEYLVIARNYAIGVALLFALAALDRRRRERPILNGVLLALLANTSVHMFFVSAILFLFFATEQIRAKNSRRVPAILVAVAGFVFAVWGLLPPVDGAHPGLVNQFEPRAIRWMIGQAFFPALRVVAAAWLGAAVLVLVLIQLRRDRRAFLVLTASGACLLYLMVFKAVGGLRHFGIFFVVVVYALWISHEATSVDGGALSRRAARVALYTSLIFALLSNLTYAWFEVSRPFSGSKEMAMYLKENGLDRRQIAAHQPAATSAILPYLPQRDFWYVAERRSGSFMLWDRRYKLAEGMPATEVAREAAIAAPASLLILNSELPRPEILGYRLRYVTREDVFGAPDEVFFLYEPSTASGYRHRASPR